MLRPDKRKNNQLRAVKITTGYLMHPAGAVLIEMGHTQVIVTASIEEKVPPHVKGTGQGWITAEYNMIPGATNDRFSRERTKVSGRTQEIQRLIGRSIRSIVDLKKLGERTITIDADVIQADGGTRTASITGAYVALEYAIRSLQDRGMIRGNPIIEPCAAVSVGIVDGELRLDLQYEEDSKAQVDMNVVMTASGKLIEVQGTAEGHAFTRDEMNRLVDLATEGIQQLITFQKNV